MSHSIKINGVNFPPGCPRDFADQVRMMVRRHNQTVDDLLTYEQTIREVESVNADLRRALNKNKIAYTELQNKYNILKDVSEKVALKYEKLLSSRNGALQKSSNSEPEIKHQKSKGNTLSDKMVQTEKTEEPLKAEKVADEKSSSESDQSPEPDQSSEPQEEDDEESLVEIESETS